MAKDDAPSSRASTPVSAQTSDTDDDRIVHVEVEHGWRASASEPTGVSSQTRSSEELNATAADWDDVTAPHFASASQWPEPSEGSLNDMGRNFGAPTR